MNYAITYRARSPSQHRPVMSNLVFPTRACADAVAGALNERWPSWEHGVRETALAVSQPDATSWLAANGFQEVV